MIPRLGVNIDHVATLRQARGESYPSLVEAAKISLESGADQITIHLREDRRHIQDTDVDAIRLVTKKYGKPLNLEMGCNNEIVDIACATSPDWVCLVPEKREEKTTEGGLDLVTSDNYEKVLSTCKTLKDRIDNIKISLFIDADEKTMQSLNNFKSFIDAVEIHTGDFARDFLNDNNHQDHIAIFESAKQNIESMGLGCHAGHGLTDQSVIPLLKEKLFTEYNIGHWIISHAVFDGLSGVVSKLKKSFSEYEV